MKETQDLTNLKFNWLTETSIPGTWALLAIVPYMPVPIGIVWVRWNALKQLEILDSHVNDQFRRQGVRTKMNTHLFETFSSLYVIVTGRGSKEGAAWMKATGYREMPNGWSVTRRRWFQNLKQKD